MQSALAYLALDIVRERSLDGERRARLMVGAGPDFKGPDRLRQDLARLAVLVSRQSAALARWLDDRPARSAGQPNVRPS